MNLTLPETFIDFLQIQNYTFNKLNQFDYKMGSNKLTEQPRLALQY